MLQNHDDRLEAELFRHARFGRRVAADRRLSATAVISALALASAAWSAPVSADEPLLLLSPASAPDDGVTRSEVTVSSHTDRRGRLVREITVRVVAVGEASPIDAELAAAPWSDEHSPLRDLARDALHDAFRTADSILDQTFAAPNPPTTDVRQLPLVSRIAASEGSGDVAFDVSGVRPDLAIGQVSAINTVPEPSTLVLFAAVSIPLWLRDKRRHLAESSWIRV